MRPLSRTEWRSRVKTKSSRYQQGSISKRIKSSGYSWRYMFRDAAGVQRVLTFDGRLFPTEKDVLKETESLRHKLNSGTNYSLIEGTRVTDCLDMWLDSLNGLKHQTMRCYKLSADRINEQFGDLKIDEVESLAIKQWLDSLPVSPSQRAHHRFVLRAMYQYAKLAKLTKIENPCDLVKLRGTTKRIKQVVILSPDDFGRLIGHVKAPYSRMVLIAGLLGLRVGEILALQWSDFDAKAGTVTIQRNWTGSHLETPKTASSSAALPVPASLMELVQTWKKEATNEWLFPSARSKHGLYSPGTIQQKVLWPACDAAEIPRVGWHTFRHSYRAWLDASGASAATSKDMMRHSDISTTLNVYGRTLPAGMRIASDAIAQLLSSNKSLDVTGAEPPQITESEG